MIENKNKLLAIIILILVPIGVVFYILWGIVFNKGTVIFEGRPPFSISISNEFVECLETSCSISVSTGEHSYTLSRGGYYDDSGRVYVKRGSEEVVEVNLDYIVQVLEEKEYKIFSFPVGYSKVQDRLLDVTLFSEYDYPLKRLPKKIEDIVFNQSGSGAVVFEEDKVSHYDTGEFVMNEIEDIYDI
jgi:hypothetical protein